MLPFAKRGDDRSNNLVRLQQLFPRIVAADYEQPKRVSEDCRHLLKRMLTPDPNKRVTIPEIMQHPWCAPLLSSPTPASCFWMALESWTDRQWLTKGRQPTLGLLLVMLLPISCI